MNLFKQTKTFILVIFLNFIFLNKISAQDAQTLEVLENLKKDIKTLEKAVYSDSSSFNSSNSKSLSSNDEDVLTRHLLKLSEIEKQFQDLTNKFEEINFKIDKLSSRLSKVQADNQLRFQSLESGSGKENIISSKKKTPLPGSSKPQDLGAVSYKSSETTNVIQQTQSVDSINIVVTENCRESQTL